MGVADALAKTERAAMDAVGARNGRLDGIDDAETAIAVAVPVKANAGFHFVQHPSDVADDGAGARRRRVADRIADCDARRALLDRGAKELTERLGLRPGRVLGDIEHGQLVLPRETDGLARVVDHLVDGPAFGVLANRTGTDERRDLDRDADPLRDLDHRPDVDLERSCRAERLDAQALVANLLGETFDIGNRARARTWKTKVDRTDAELVGQVQEAKLVFDIGVAHRRALDAIAERLIVNGHGVGWLRRRVDRVPVVNQLRLVRHCW